MVNLNHSITRHKNVLKLLTDYPDRRMTVREISKLSNTPYMTVSRCAKLFEKAGLIEIEKIGGSNSCRLNQNSPLIPEIKKFLGAELSHHRLALKAFLAKAKRIKSIEKIILFGSLSKGKEKPESDVDVAIVGRLGKEDKSKTEKSISEILEKTKVNIVPVYFTVAELEKRSQLSKDLKSGEILYERHKRS